MEREGENKTLIGTWGNWKKERKGRNTLVLALEGRHIGMETRIES